MYLMPLVYFKVFSKLICVSLIDKYFIYFCDLSDPWFLIVNSCDYCHEVGSRIIIYTHAVDVFFLNWRVCNFVNYIPSILFNIENCICECTRIPGCATGGSWEIDFAIFTVHIFMDSQAHVMFLNGGGLGFPQ